MNGTFLETAFTDKEQAAIKPVTLDNTNGYETSTMWRAMRDGNETTDQVFPLDCKQAEQLFGHKRGYNGFNLTILRGNGICEATAYAVSRGAKTDDNGCCYWWLRSPGTLTFEAAYVSPMGSEGTVRCAGNTLCARPSIVVNLDQLRLISSKDDSPDALVPKR